MMKKYPEPSMTIEKFDFENVITASGNLTTNKETKAVSGNSAILSGGDILSGE